MPIAATAGHRTRRAAHMRPLSRAGWIVLAVLALLVGARLAAPHFLLKYVNRTLDGLEGYTGHVGDIEMSLWRGAYQIDDVRIQKESGNVPVPLFSARRIDLSVQWKALLHGAIVAAIELDHPELNFVEGPKEASSQTKPASNWKDQAKALFPLDINRVGIRAGEVHFRNFHTSPRVDIYIQDIHGSIENLTNSERLSKTLAATADIRGLAMHSGRFFVRAKIDPYAEAPTFDLKAGLENLDMPQLNPFLRAYAGLDVSRGQFAVYSEIQSTQGHFRGYVKPFLENVKVLGPEDKNKSFFGKVWNAIAEGTKDLFENEKTDQVATRVPISGSMTSPEADVWTAIWFVLRNAFIQAIQHGLESQLKGQGG